jgi:hypothetical protein
LTRPLSFLALLPVLGALGCGAGPTPVPGCPTDDADCDGVTSPTDCDDSDATVSPDRGERCDGKDNNCDGAVDEGFDQDGDGVTTCEGDCDDGDPTTYAGAVDLCEDGIDNDCNGLLDDGPDDDNDGDGVCTPLDCDDADPDVSPSATEVCDGDDENCDGVIDEGFDADDDGVTSCAGDCDDANPAVFPGATEICDGQDDDCDGTPDAPLVDSDDDGDGVDACLGEDCDDADPTVYPGAFEIPDGADDDCDGVIDDGWQGQGGLDLFDAAFAGADSLAALGSVVSAAGDVDGDGLSDFLVSAPQRNGGRGRVQLFLGEAFALDAPPSGIGPAVTLDGTVESAQLGAALALVDLDDDGFDDVVVGAPYGGPGIGPEGAVRIFWGGANVPTGTWSPDDADVVILGSYGVERCGAALAHAGDMNGDGRADLAIGCPSYTTPDGLVGRTVVFAGRVRSAWASAGGSADADLLVVGGSSETYSGSVLGGNLDVNGDGRSDLLIGSPFYALDAGRVGLKLGTATFGGTLELDDVERVWTGSAGDELGAFLGGGDLDGDGRDEVLLGAPGAGSGAGRLLILPGAAAAPASGSASARATRTLAGTGADRVGTSGAIIDLSGDETPDVLVGVPGWSGPLGGGQGQVALLLGPVPLGQTLVSAAPAHILGEAGGDALGDTLIGLPDGTGDGQPDLVVTAPYSDRGASNGGLITLVPGFP